VNDDDKTPVDRALDLILFAPLGLALEARALLPKLVERGRQQVTGQVTMARVVGQFAVQQGQAEAGKRLAAVWEQADALLNRNGARAADEAPRHDGGGDGGAGGPGGGAGGAGGGAAAEPPPPAAEPVARRSAPDAGRLAIPDYDSLSASQVVPRLAGLATDELEAVRAYEAETRGRKTILNRVAQLQG
jgi:hypothetical protein